jgi:hypothetical protein
LASAWRTFAIAAAAFARTRRVVAERSISSRVLAIRPNRLAPTERSASGGEVDGGDGEVERLLGDDAELVALVADRLDDRRLAAAAAGAEGDEGCRHDAAFGAGPAGRGCPRDPERSRAAIRNAG